MLNILDKPITKKQDLVLGVVVSYIRTHGYSPTFRNICELTGISSTNGVKSHLDVLVRKEYITYSSRITRSICLTDKAKNKYGMNINHYETLEKQYTDLGDILKTHQKAVERLRKLIENHTSYINKAGYNELGEEARTAFEEGAQRVLDEVWAIMIEEEVIEQM